MIRTWLHGLARLTHRGRWPVVALAVAALAAGDIASVATGRGPAGPSRIGLVAADQFRCSATGSRATGTVPVTGLSGSRDDSAVIQRAIDTAARRGGGVVSLPAGIFPINGHLVLRDNVRLSGAGPATVLEAGPRFLSAQGPAGGYPVISTAGAVNVTIADLTADQGGDTLDGNVPARLSGYAVEGRGSRNVLIDSVRVRNTFSYAIAMVDTTGFCVTDSTVSVTGRRYSQLDGIHILDSSSGQVINNRITSGDDGLAAHTIGAPVHDVLFANNEVRGGRDTDGLQLAVGDFAIYNIEIENNDFSGTRFGIRTGYYDGRTGAVHDIVIENNYIHDLTLAGQSPAIAIGGFGGLGPVSQVTVLHNLVCRAGPVTVTPGPGVRVRGTARGPGRPASPPGVQATRP